MQRRIFCFLLIGLFSCWSAVSALSQNYLPTVLGMRFGHHEEQTRFVLDLTQDVEFKVFTLSNPDRVVIDLSRVSWGNIPLTASGKGLVTRYRTGTTNAGKSRLVLDTNRPVKLKKSFLLSATAQSPARIVFDLQPATPDLQPQQIISLQKPSPVVYTPPPPVQKKPVKKSKKIIVIDPGHGGNDPGAVSASGLLEKKVVLSFARVLRRALEKTGRYKVIMTRDRDIYIKLRNRVKKSRAANADLFLSIHADSAPNKKARGTSIYTLSETSSDKESARLAARENRSDIIAGLDLNEEENEVANILIDLAMRESMNQSKYFANLVVEKLKDTSLTLVKTPHRSAGFAVLKAPDVPSVLVELGYLSNRQEARKLVNKKHQRHLAGTLTKSINLYFNHLQKAEAF